jgi:uridine kinase
MATRPYLVGITGGSGSGKTYFLNKLMEQVGVENVCLISQDNYYRPREEQPLDAQGIPNFDLPESIDDAEYSRDILALCEGKTVYREEYTFNNPNVVPRQLVFEPRPLLIIEGLFVFYFQEISKLLDLKIFVDAKIPVKMRRRIIRDNRERGYDLEDVLYRYENHVLPTYERYLMPFYHTADLVVPNNLDCKVALEVISFHLKNKIL